MQVILCCKSIGLEQVASLLAAPCASEVTTVWRYRNSIIIIIIIINKGFWMFQVTVKSTFVWLGIAAAVLRDVAAGH